MIKLDFLEFEEGAKNYARKYRRYGFFTDLEFNALIVDQNIDELSVVKNIVNSKNVFFNVRLFDRFGVSSRCDASHCYHFSNEIGCADFNFTRNYAVDKKGILRRLFQDEELGMQYYGDLKIPAMISTLEVECKFADCDQLDPHSDPCLEIISEFTSKDCFIEVNDKNLVKLMCAPGFMYEIFDAAMRPQFLIQRRFFKEICPGESVESNLIHAMANNDHMKNKIGYVDSFAPLGAEHASFLFDICNWGDEDEPIPSDEYFICNEQLIADYMWGRGNYEIAAKEDWIEYRKTNESRLESA